MYLLLKVKTYSSLFLKDMEGPVKLILAEGKKKNTTKVHNQITNVS